ncbi:MAG TPA: serine/threonine-protein kinase [Planctomycetota bacterium]|nr:serine/threonine-protein kinase [Planctomycetota bacterium]
MGDSSAGTEEDELAPGSVLGGYRIVDRIARGGMGTVYRACQLSMDRVVALKVLPRHLAADPDYARRFEREARVAGGCEHPNLIRVFEVGAADGWSFYAMEHIDGPTLAKLSRSGGPIEEAKAVRWMARLAAALGEAHRAGVVHRDVKPDNILLAPGGEPKLADLGLAKRADGRGDITAAGDVIGTPRFMAPEQARGEALDGRADLYALGATFFRLLTGRHVYEASSPQAVLLKQAREDAPRARTFNPTLSRALDQVLARLLERDRDDRYADADALISDLERIARNQTLPMRPDHPRAAPVVGHAQRAHVEATRAHTPRRLRARSRWPLWLAGCLIGCACGGVALALGPEERAGAPSAADARLAAAHERYTAARGRMTRSGADYDRLIGDLVATATYAKGTSLEREVATALATARAARAALARRETPPAATATPARDLEAAFAAAQLAATALAAAGDIDGAWSAYTGLDREVRDAFDERIAEALQTIGRAARERIEAALAASAAATAAGRYADARAALADLDGLRWRDGLDKAAHGLSSARLAIDSAETAANAAFLAASRRLASAVHDRLIIGDQAGAKARIATADDALAVTARECRAVVDLIIARPRALRAAVTAAIGTRLTLTVRGARRVGEVAEVDDRGFALVTVVSGERGSGQSRVHVGWSEVDAAEAEPLIRSQWQPEGAAGSMAEAYLALSRGAAAEAAAFVSAAAGHPLATAMTEATKEAVATAK